MKGDPFRSRTRRAFPTTFPTLQPKPLVSLSYPRLPYPFGPSASRLQADLVRADSRLQADQLDRKVCLSLPMPALGLAVSRAIV